MCVILLRPGFDLMYCKDSVKGHIAYLVSESNHLPSIPLWFSCFPHVRVCIFPGRLSWHLTIGESPNVGCFTCEWKDFVCDIIIVKIRQKLSILWWREGHQTKTAQGKETKTRKRKGEWLSSRVDSTNMESWEQTGMIEHGVFRELLIWDDSSWGAKGGDE